MGFFGKIFEKKQCSVCGGEIGLIGNRKLEDGNMCKNCAAKLSPWFSDRRSSTVEQINEQLRYRDLNQFEVQKFEPTKSLGVKYKVLVDERNGKFIVTDEKDWRKTNPDVIDISAVRRVEIRVDEGRNEDKTKDSQGKSISYNPPRYFYYYNFTAVITVDHPYFDEIEFLLNNHHVELNRHKSVPQMKKPLPLQCVEYMEYQALGVQIKAALSQNSAGYQNSVTNAAQASGQVFNPSAAPIESVPPVTAAEPAVKNTTCAACGATGQTGKFCEYCGSEI